MSVIAYTGLPGSGKSYGVVENVVLPALKAGRVVVTNVALRVPELEAAIPGADVRLFSLEEVRSNKQSLDDVAPPGCVLIIDEVQKLWPSGTRADKANPGHLAFLTEHRHKVDAADQSMQIVLCTQDLANVATFVRSLVEFTYRSVKLSALGMNKRFRIDVYEGPASGANPPAKNVRRKMTGTYKPEVYKFYQSHTQSEGTGGANESAVDKRMVIWRSPLFYLGVPVLLVLLIGGGFKLWGMFHPEPKVPKRTAAELSASSPGRKPDILSAPEKTSRWRISIDMRGGERDMVYFSDGRRFVGVPASDYCDRDVSGYLSCRWEGAVITNRFHELPEAPVLAGRDYAALGRVAPPEPLQVLQAAP